jgi:5-methylthioadenosine/S-adenosylhomocysteine deaminase
MPDSGPVAADLLLTGGVLVTVDDERRVIEPGAIAVTGDRIVGVFEGPPPASLRAGRTVDCTGRAVVPGFVDCHTHLFQTLARGLGEGLGGWRWLAEFMWPYAGALTSADVRAAVRAGAVEAVRTGITAVLDHHYGLADADTTLDVAAVLSQVGLRGTVARGMAGPPSEVSRQRGLPGQSFRASAAEELQATRSCMRARPAGGSVHVAPGPINIVYTEPELVLASAALAREGGTLWHTHLCAPREDPELFRRTHGVWPVAWLASNGALGPGTTLAHATWLRDEEVALLGETATGVAHLPVSNEYMPYGVMRLRDLRRAGATVGLGTDGSACGHRQDPFEQMKMAVLLQRVHALDPTAATAEEALELATREGARYLGIDAGQIAEGRLADLAVVDLQRPHLTPRHRAVSALVYSATPADVVMTIVGGEIVYQDGACTRVDEAEVMAEAQARAGDLVRRAGLDGLREPWRRAGARASR